MPLYKIKPTNRNYRLNQAISLPGDFRNNEYDYCQNEYHYKQSGIKTRTKNITNHLTTCRRYTQQKNQNKVI